MPQIIRTPEDVFREEGKDIYVVSFKDEDGAAAKQAERDLIAWLKANLPGTPVETLGFSEKSGWISGGVMGLRIDFSEEGLKRFCDRWENANGESLDKRFQCFLLQYKTWLEKSRRYMPTRDQPEGPALTLWVDTPLGFIYHQLSAKDTKKLKGKMHPASWRDLFWHAQKLWPELEGVDTDKLTHGNICQEEENETWVVWYSDDAFRPFAKSRKVDLRRFFCLPPKTPVRCSY